MTEPTDDELDAVIAEYRAGIYSQDMHPRFERAIMRAAIAKWGTPPAHSGEPVAWLDPWTGTKATTDYDAYGKHGIPLYLDPQPVEREPLTDTQIKELIEDGVFLGNCKEIVRAIEQVHGITQRGGQHGTE